MNTATPAIRDFARRLVAVEATGGGAPGAEGRVCDRLRVPLSRLAGVAGFRSLLSRAVALARAEVPALAAVQVRPDATLEGLDDLGPEPGVVVVAQLVGLLVTFIGEPLTLALVRDAWPGAALTGIDSGSGDGT
ncbi:MAG TPA: hypothetical protein VD866_32455 [Urbifossiella sp.]|nr:hypothetical protein [Urbifossiella sp.]